MGEWENKNNQLLKLQFMQTSENQKCFEVVNNRKTLLQNFFHFPISGDCRETPQPTPHPS